MIIFFFLNFICYKKTGLLLHTENFLEYKFTKKDFTFLKRALNKKSSFKFFPVMRILGSGFATLFKKSKAQLSNFLKAKIPLRWGCCRIWRSAAISGTWDAGRATPTHRCSPSCTCPQPFGNTKIKTKIFEEKATSEDGPGADPSLKWTDYDTRSCGDP